MAFTYGKDILDIYTDAFCLLVLNVLAESSSAEMINVIMRSCAMFVKH